MHEEFLETRTDRKVSFLCVSCHEYSKESASKFLSIELDRITKLAGFKHGWNFQSEYETLP